MTAAVSRLLRATQGASLVGYLVIVGVVALACAAGYRAFGTGLYSKVRTEGDHVVSLTPMQGGSNYCFVAGTLVDTPSGPRPIEALRAGDDVTSRTDDGAIVVKRAVATFVTPDAALVEVRVREASGASEPLRATPGHRFFTVDRGWVEAAALAPGEPLVDRDGAPRAVASVTRLAERATVYNVEVEDTHTYFVGAARLWVHNPTDCNGAPIEPVTDPCPNGQCAPGSDSCFVAGTRVATPRGPVPIESLHPGDAVFAPSVIEAASTAAGSWERATIAPFASFAASGPSAIPLALPPSISGARFVTRTYGRRVTSLVTIRTARGEVRATLEHPFMTVHGWLPAHALARGDRVATREGSLAAEVLDVRVDEVPPTDVYNFAVADEHTYAVGPDELVVHNYCGPNSVQDAAGQLGPLRPGGETKFFPGRPGRDCITQDELQQLAQEDSQWTAGWTTMDPSGVSQQDWTQTNAQRPSSCSTVLCDSSTGMCFSGQAGRPFGPSNSDQGGDPQVCAEALEKYLQSFPPPRPENWGSLNCAEKRALLQWMDYQRNHNQSIDPRGKGLFVYSVAPDQPGCPDKAACRNCQTHMPALGIYSASDARNPRTGRMNNGVPRPAGLCP